MFVELLGGARHAPMRDWSSVVFAYGDLLPQYPSTAVVQAAILPAPPLMTADMPKIKAVRGCALWYRGVMRHLHGHAGNVLIEAEDKRNPKTLLSARGFQPILDCLPVLIEQQIAPASWCLFSARVWAEYIGQPRQTWDSAVRRAPAKRTKMPPVSWVYSAARMRNHDLWFRWSEAHCRGGRIHVSSPHKALLSRYARLRDALLCEATLDAERVRALVVKHLPAAEYARLVREARAAAEFQRDAYAHDLQRGIWLW